MDNRKVAKFALYIAKQASWELMKSENEVTTGEQTNSSSPGRSLYLNETTPSQRNEIYNALFTISPTLALSYDQVKKDILDANRLSWAGTAHEIREIIAQLLRLLAPDKDVRSQTWFKQDPSTKGITQAQRARYVLQLRNQGSSTIEVVERNVFLLDERIGELVRSTYTRASDAAHTFKDQGEVKRILSYFEALVHDLIDIKDS